MKKLSPRYKKWLLYHSRGQVGKTVRINRWKREIVEAWLGADREDILVLRGRVTPPKELCYEKNLDETSAFFERLRRNMHSSYLRTKSLNKDEHALDANCTDGSFWLSSGPTERSMRRISRFYDFSKIEFISTAAALTLAAEFDRFRRLVGSVPPTINLDKWNRNLFRKLFEIGFFEIVGLSADVADRFHTDGDVRCMRIISGTDSANINEAADAILALSEFAEQVEPLNPAVSLALNSSLSEAMANVAFHAYPLGHKYRVKHVGKWWVTATVDRVHKNLTVVIYDQGASIPVTFPQKSMSDAVTSFLRSALGKTRKFAYANDGEYIAAALLPGKTQTNQRNRGLGLPKMKDLIDTCGDGSLMILSRG